MKLLKEYIRLLVESALKPKVIFMAGAPGSGKSTIRSRLGITGFEIVDPDEAYEAALKLQKIPLNIAKLETEYYAIKDKMEAAVEVGDKTEINKLKPEYDRLRDIASRKGVAFAAALKSAKDRQRELAAERKDVIVDGTGGDYKAINNLKQMFEKSGYDTAMLFVHVDLETSMERNRARGEAGGRSLRDRTVEKNWQNVHKNEQPYRQLFGDNFFYVDATNMDQSIPEVKERIKGFINTI